MNIGDHVSWDRDDLPRGTGMVVEIVKLDDENSLLYMVRDQYGIIYGFAEDELKVEN
jgi:hypothetical protein